MSKRGRYSSPSSSLSRSPSPYDEDCENEVPEPRLPPPVLPSTVDEGEEVKEDFCEAPFSLARVDRPVTVVIVADKRVGKTTLAASLVMGFREILGLDLALALTTSDDPTYFANILPERLIKRKTIPVVEATNLLKQQRNLQKENAGIVARTCMVFDNVFFAAVDFKGMTDFFQNAHNANILPIFTTTDPSIMPKQLQDTADFVFIARSMRHNTRKKCWQTFGDMYEKFEDFNDALARLGPHSFLVMDKTSRSRDLNKIVSSFTPPLYRPAPITAAEANAFGKWHLLRGEAGAGVGGDEEEDSLMEEITACQSYGTTKGSASHPMVREHETFEVGGPKVTRLCSSLGIILPN